MIIDMIALIVIDSIEIPHKSGTTGLDDDDADAEILPLGILLLLIIAWKMPASEFGPPQNRRGDTLG